MDPSQPVKGVDASAGGASPDLEYIIAPLMFMSHGFIPAPPGESVCTIVGTKSRFNLVYILICTHYRVPSCYARRVPAL